MKSVTNWYCQCKTARSGGCVDKKCKHSQIHVHTRSCDIECHAKRDDECIPCDLQSKEKEL
jgi:hypothetical protein